MVDINPDKSIVSRYSLLIVVAFGQVGVPMDWGRTHREMGFLVRASLKRQNVSERVLHSER